MIYLYIYLIIALCLFAFAGYFSIDDFTLKMRFDTGRLKEGLELSFGYPLFIILLLCEYLIINPYTHFTNKRFLVKKTEKNKND